MTLEALNGTSFAPLKKIPFDSKTQALHKAIEKAQFSNSDGVYVNRDRKMLDHPKRPLPLAFALAKLQATFEKEVCHDKTFRVDELHTLEDITLALAAVRLTETSKVFLTGAPVAMQKPIPMDLTVGHEVLPVATLYYDLEMLAFALQKTLETRSLESRPAAYGSAPLLWPSRLRPLLKSFIDACRASLESHHRITRMDCVKLKDLEDEVAIEYRELWKFYAHERPVHW